MAVEQAVPVSESVAVAAARVAATAGKLVEILAHFLGRKDCVVKLNKSENVIILSKSKFGHTFSIHGEENTKFLIKRAKGSGLPQGQFLDSYNYSFNDDVQLALMALIFASYDEYLNEHERNTSIDEKIREIIIANKKNFHGLLKYWASEENKNPNYGFKVTLLAREILLLLES